MLQILNKHTSQIITDITVMFITAPISEKVLRAYVVIYALEIFLFDIGYIGGTLGKPIVLILMIVVIVLT